MHDIICTSHFVHSFPPKFFFAIDHRNECIMPSSPVQPSSATIDGGPTIRKLFHAVDDELIRVPNAVSY